MPKVSVIIPIFNAGQYLRQCLESVASQTARDIEIICVDDGSSDDSVEVLKSYALQDERIRVFTQKNQGVSAARNAGLDLASGEYVAFLDADDFFEPTMIEEMYTSCTAHDADIGICKIRYLYIDKGTQIEASWSLRMDLLPDTLPFNRADMTANLLLSMTPSVWNKLFKRSFIAEHGLRFSPELQRAEDVAFTYLALINAQRVTAVDKALVNYRSGNPTGLQATVHERPAEICRALADVKRIAVEAGSFCEVEQDFVNAAIDQCLYTLHIVRTPDAFRELYGALTSKYLAELGIEGRTEDYFADTNYYKGYSMIRALSSEDYLFEQAKDLRGQRDHSREQRRETLDALSETRFALGELEIERARDAEELSLAAAQVVSLGEQLAEIRNQLFNEARSLREQLDETRIEVKRATAKLNGTSAKLKMIRASRSYKAGRIITAIPRRLRRLYRTLRKAK